MRIVEVVTIVVRLAERRRQRSRRNGVAAYRSRGWRAGRRGVTLSQPGVLEQCAEGADLALGDLVDVAPIAGDVIRGAHD